MDPPNLDFLKFETTDVILTLFLFVKICLDEKIFKSKLGSFGIMTG